jgi:Zn-finger nucleic acid-binding protein
MELPEDAEEGERMCPRCSVKMSVFQYPTTHVTVDMCPDCHGLWLDGGELVEIAASRNAKVEQGPRYGYRPNVLWTYLVEKVQQTEGGEELRQYHLDNLQLHARHDEYFELDQTQIAINRSKKSHQALYLDKKGRFFDKDGLHGFVGSAGIENNPVVVSHIYDVYYFPWLPDEPLTAGSRWDIEFQAGSSTELQGQSIFEMEAHFSVADISQHRGRECAEIRFTYEGNRKGTAEEMDLNGRGTWIFDLEHNVDVMLEKNTQSTISPVSGETATTQHTVRRVLSEKALDFVSSSE